MIMHSTDFSSFMARVLAPGAIVKDGAPLDVQRLDDVRGLSAFDLIENEWLSELEQWPLPTDNVPDLFDGVRRCIKRWR